ncbi:MAG: hypothetical protein PHF60_03050 [Candidatus ainarchaeum sp.]|nr:hypothetical protein [Candidatus ainarchaeum sp.]
MAGALAKRSEDARVPALAMAKGFKGYGPIEQQPVRKIEIVEDKTLRQLRESWKAFRYAGGAPKKEYDNALSLLKGFEYSAADVEKFSIALAEFEVEGRSGCKAGFFLSALMNSSNDTEFIIHTTQLAEPPYYLGCRNTKNITVKGNAGGGAGYRMQGGTITVEGDADIAVGDSMEDGAIIVRGNAGYWLGPGMQGGSIVVEGNAGPELGKWMKDGSITVVGDAGDFIGILMQGGEIYLEGNYGRIADGFEHGKIFHKGVLIFER